MQENLESLIYDWNAAGEQPSRSGRKKIEFDDETLRDGLQSPSVTDPSLDEKVRALHFMNDVGVDSADVRVGMPVRVTWEALSDGRNLPVFEP